MRAIEVIRMLAKHKSAYVLKERELRRLLKGSTSEENKQLHRLNLSYVIGASSELQNMIDTIRKMQQLADYEKPADLLSFASKQTKK